MDPLDPDAAPPEPQEIQVVATVGDRLDGVIATLRDYLHFTGAARALAVVEYETGRAPALVDVPRLGPIEVTLDDQVVALPHAIELDAAAAPLPGDLRQLPPVEVRIGDGDEIQLTGTIGGLEHMARGVLSLAAAIGKRNVALAFFDTTTPELPLTVSARVGDPVVVTIGEQELDMPEGWPPPAAA
jgi:hypothetical protein